MPSKKQKNQDLTALLEDAENFAWTDWHQSCLQLAHHRRRASHAFGHASNATGSERQELRTLLDMAITAEQTAYRRWLKACAAQDAWLDGPHPDSGHHQPPNQRPNQPNPS